MGKLFLFYFVLMRFWGSDFYTFDLEKRKRVTAIISAVLSVITTVISLFFL